MDGDKVVVVVILDHVDTMQVSVAKTVAVVICVVICLSSVRGYLLFEHLSSSIPPLSLPTSPIISLSRLHHHKGTTKT